VLSHVTALNAPSFPEDAARLAAALRAGDLAGGVYDLARRVGAPTGLRELGLEQADLDAVTAEVAALANPVPFDAGELLHRIWAGARPDGDS
jgi:alcohol dehydrogenase class IV